MEPVTKYLGDGVYVQWDGYNFILMTNSYKEPTDKIYLEPEILASLIGFAKRQTEATNGTES